MQRHHQKPAGSCLANRYTCMPRTLLAMMLCSHAACPCARSMRCIGLPRVGVDVTLAANSSSLIWLSGKCVDAEIVPNACKSARPATPDSIIHTQGWRDCDGRIGLGLQKHVRPRSCQQCVRHEFQARQRHRAFPRPRQARAVHLHGVQWDKFELPLCEAFASQAHAFAGTGKDIQKTLRHPRSMGRPALDCCFRENDGVAGMKSYAGNGQTRIWRPRPRRIK